MSSSIVIQAGRAAYQHLQQHGLSAEHIGVIPAAAGGPKGLILQALDQWLFGEFLSNAPRPRSFIGASIGAWRMAAACHADPAAAFARLGDLYCEQRYPRKPSAQRVTEEIAGILQQLMRGHEHEVLSHPHHHLHLITARGRQGLQHAASNHADKLQFAKAALRNLFHRQWLSKTWQRVLFGDARDRLDWMRTPFDQFDSAFQALTPDNVVPALLASGTLPLIMQAVTQIPATPAGRYWDGGLIDYHLFYPYHRLSQTAPDDLVLYPHFTNYIVPGWLDKGLKWRHQGRGKSAPWLDNVIVISPSAEFLRRLPRQKLPDREDFFHYDLDHTKRIADWKIAMREAERLRDDLAAFCARPSMSEVRRLNF